MTQYALLVGIGRYEDPSISEVRYADADVLALRECLVELLGFEEKHIYVYTNRQGENYGKSTAIMKRFAQLCRVMGPEDGLLFYFSGHGIERGDGIHLLTADSDTYSASVLKTSSVPITFLREEMEHARVSNRVFIIDACRNDPEKGKGEGDNVLTDTFSKEIILAARSRPSTVVNPATGLWFACSRGERAYEWDERGQGVFSCCVLEGLRALSREREAIDLGLLHKYVADRVQGWCREHLPRGRMQTPWLITEGRVPQLEMARRAPVGGGTGRKEIEPDRPWLTTRRMIIASGVCGAVLLSAALIIAYNFFPQLVFWRALLVDTGKPFANSLGMQFTYIHPGTFTMGSPPDEYGRDNDENQHRVRLTRGYYMQTTEVTQGQWKAIMGDNPSHFAKCGDECPVEQVSCSEVQEFIRRLNQKEGTDRYRLPTEAEWEYACRTNTNTPFSNGKCLSSRHANYQGDHPMPAGCAKGEFRQTTLPVKALMPNAWGIYGMHGNVWEWCQDWYGDYSSDSLDPIGPQRGSSRVARGGGWISNAGFCRCASRVETLPDFKGVDLGFRLACDARALLTRRLR